MKFYILIAFPILLIYGCFGAGTHGSIKGYEYIIVKDSLQNAIMKVINNSPNIYRDTSLDELGSMPSTEKNDGRDHVANSNYYNDINNYVTIKITSGKNINKYIFRYYGGEETWRSSPTSKIFICYAFDNENNGGSEGSGEISKKMKNQFTEIFENEFISKIDRELN